LCTDSENKEERIKKLTEVFNTAQNAGSIASDFVSSSAMISNYSAMGVGNGSLGLFNASLTSGTSWLFAGIVYTAETGVNYKKLKRGQISKDEFWKRTKVRAAGTFGGIAGGTGGTVAGFTMGTMIFPGVGSVVGAVMGGFAGGVAGDLFVAKFYGTMDERLKTVKLERKK
jgi:hypothetical protein